MHRGIEANVEAQLARLEGFRALLETIFQESSGDASSSTRRTLLSASVLRVLQSANAVGLLAGAGCVEEVLSLGRTLVEVTVNAAYFQYAREGELDRFLHFHPESRAGLLAAPARPQGFAGRVRRRVQTVLFGAATTQGDPQWSAKPLLDRARSSDEHSRLPVMVPLVTRGYPRGHAAVHGTVASLETFMTSVRTMQAPRAENRMVDLTDALFGVNLCLLTLCVFLNQFFGLKMDEAIDEAANAETRTRLPALESDASGTPRQIREQAS